MLGLTSTLEVRPTLEETLNLKGDHNLVPVCQTFLEDCETPVSAFLKLRGAGPAFLLESAEQGQRVGRWSFIGYRPRHVVRWSLQEGGDPYELAAAEVERHRQAPLPGLPPFAGGAVGFFGYDCVRTVEPLGPPNPDTIGLPDLALMLTDALVAFDHLKHTVTILANAYVEEEGVEAGYGRALGVIAEVRERALQARKCLVGHRFELPVVEARALAGVAGRAGGLDEREHRVGVAVVAQRAHGLRVARGRALAPELVARAAPQVQLAGGLRPLQRLGVHVGEREHLARGGVLHHAGDESSLVVGDLLVHGPDSMAERSP